MCQDFKTDIMLYIRPQRKTKFYYSYTAYVKISFRFIGLLRCNCIAGNSIQGENII
jgi:hypothetical protein